MKTQVSFIKKIGNISIYHDPGMEDGRVLVGYKGNEVENPGYIYVPTQAFNEALANCEGSAIEKDEVDKILKNAPRDFSRVTFVVCNIGEEKIEKMIETVKERYEP